MTGTSMRVLVMAAGTGGHVFPGLAIASELRARGHQVQWLGTTQGMENKWVPGAGLELFRVGFNGLRGKGIWGALTGGIRLLQAFWQSLSLIRQHRIDLVLGMGGYVCFPGGMAAALSGKPLVLVNADAGLLLSNKLLLPLADAIVFGFDGEITRELPKAVVTGNPVRAEIRAIQPPELRFRERTGRLRVLVVGGSSGAKFLNETVALALSKMDSTGRPEITHQTGQAHWDWVKSHYRDLGVEADVVPFIDDMALALENCDVIVCRAGALTVSEICAGGVASALVPLVISTTQHQAHNAQWLSAQGAALHLPQAEMTPDSLAKVLLSLDRAALLNMALRARALDRPMATRHIVELCERLHGCKAAGSKPQQGATE